MKHALITGLILLAGATGVFPQTPATAPEGYPAAGAPAIVKLISAGTAPRTALRYTPAAGAKQHMNTSMTMSMSMDMAGASMPAMTVPPVTIGADFTITDVSPTGDVTFTLAFTGVTAEAGSDSPVLAQLLAMNDDFKQIKGTGSFSSRGVTRNITVDLGKFGGSPIGQVVGSMTDTIKNVSTPLPEEEVGVGARWEARLTVSNQGMTIYQKAEFELVALDGRTVSLKTKMQQMAPPQAVSNPALPQGTDVQLERYSGGGSGTVRLDLSTLIPSSEATMDSEMVMNINVGGDSQQMGMKTSVKFTVSPAK